MHRKLVVDSSILIALSRKGKLEDHLRKKKKEGYEVIIPKAIVEEVILEPKRLAEEIGEMSPVLAGKIADSVKTINAAIEQRLIKVETVNYSRYSKVMDNARKHLSKLEAKQEHAIKKGDPELIALVIQLYEEAQEKVFVSTMDKGLLKALKSFSNKVEYEVLESL